MILNTKYILFIYNCLLYIFFLQYNDNKKVNNSYQVFQKYGTLTESINKAFYRVFKIMVANML